MSTLYSDFKTRVEQELDLEEEDFIQSAEFLEYVNKARREAEAEVLGIYEDYFLDSTSLALVTGTSKYNLPSNIYARKIRNIVYSVSTLIYEITRIRGPKQFLERAMLIQGNPTDYYQYIILNNATNGIQIELSPPSRETSSTNVTVWFLRKVVDITGATLDTVDSFIPESINFLYAYVKGKCKQKENAGVMPPDAQQEIEMERKLMIETLTNSVPDDDNKALMDMTVYDESS